MRKDSVIALEQSKSRCYVMDTETLMKRLTRVRKPLIKDMYNTDGTYEVYGRQQKGQCRLRRIECTVDQYFPTAMCQVCQVQPEGLSGFNYLKKSHHEIKISVHFSRESRVKKEKAKDALMRLNR